MVPLGNQTCIIRPVSYTHLPHGPATGATTCQIYMRRFNDGDTITVEPWRSAGFPVIKDLMVDRTAYDKIMQDVYKRQGNIEHRFYVMQEIF